MRNMLVNGDKFMVASNEKVVTILFNDTGYEYELSHERARVLAETILAALKMWE